MNWQEFKPTIFFLAKFLGLYLVGNLVYGFFVTAYEPQADPVTRFVTEQTADLLTLLGWTSETYNHHNGATVSIVYEDKAIVSVYEGCNGVNVILIFLVFLISFGPINKKLPYFILFGILLIHISNLTRIALLFFVSLRMPEYLYFSHKYLFTAFIYTVVLMLWMYWVRKFSIVKGNAE